MSVNLDFIIHNWRCFSKLDVSIPSSPFVISDENGSGKTSLLAAFYSLHTGQPWPQTRLIESLKNSTDYYGVITHFPDWSLSGQINPSGRLTNKYQQPKSHPFTSKKDLLFPQIFTYLPNDNIWFNMSRSSKLATLDSLLSLCYYDDYTSALKKLNRLIKAKSELIRYTRDHSVSPDMTMVNYLSDQILEYSNILWRYRSEFFDIIRSSLPEFQKWIQNSIATIRVKHKITDQNGLQNENNLDVPLNSLNWEKLWVKEISAGKPLFGAHRDDFVLQMNHLQVQNMFSRGEMRLLVLFIKSIAQQIYLQKSPNRQTFWLLDDVFNELDSKRETIFFHNVLNSSKFYIITSTKKVEIPITQFSINDISHI